MNDTTQSLQINIHKVDGSVATFTQSQDHQVNQILNEFQPSRIFNEDKITFAGIHSETTLVPSLITRVDLITDRLSVWDFPFTIGALLELTEGEFHDFLCGRQRRMQRHSPSDFPMSLEIELADGHRVFLWMEIIAGYPTERLLKACSLLKERSLVFELLAGGVGVLNPENIARFMIHPDPQKGPVEVWHNRKFDALTASQRTGDSLGTVVDQQPLSRYLRSNRTDFTLPSTEMK